jgi:hypothetical protein
MRRRLLSALLVALAAAAVSLQAQTTPARSIPRTADGKPDLSGVWQAMNTAAWNIQNHVAEKGVPAGIGVVEGDEIPYQPWALKKKAGHARDRGALDPESKCLLPGVPRITYMPFPFEIAQTPNTTAIMYEYVHALRTIFTDGTSHPDGHIDWWMGDSRGRWDGDSLLVDVVDFNDQTWFDRAGNFHSEQLHIIERYTMSDPDHIQYEVTIEDPKVFTRPWTMRMPLYRRIEKNIQLLEYECYAFDEPFHLTP